MVSKIEHIGIASSRPETLARWYRETLGFEEVTRLGKNREIIFLTLPGGGIPVEILPQPRPEGTEERQPGPGQRKAGQQETEHPDERPKDTHGTVHLAMRVSDFEAALRTVRAGGAEIVSENRQGPAGTMLALFRDPEGNLLQFVHRSEIPGWMEE